MDGCVRGFGAKVPDPWYGRAVLIGCISNPSGSPRVRALSGQDLVPVLEIDGAVLTGSLDIVAHLEERFPQGTLQRRDHMTGDGFGYADLAVFPFLRYGVRLHDEDVETFHRILAEHLLLEPRHARLRTWIERVDARPRAGLAALEDAGNATVGS